MFRIFDFYIDFNNEKIPRRHLFNIAYKLYFCNKNQNHVSCVHLQGRKLLQGATVKQGLSWHSVKNSDKSQVQMIKYKLILIRRKL